MDVRSHAELIALENSTAKIHQSVSEAVVIAFRPPLIPLGGFVDTLMTGDRHTLSLPAILATDRHNYSSLLDAVSIGTDAPELAPPFAFAVVERSTDHRAITMYLNAQEGDRF